MSLEGNYYLGKIIKPYGTKGEVLVKLDTDEPEIYEDLESVFLKIKGQPVPFFIEDARMHKSHLLRVKFEDVNHIEDAQKLVGRQLYLPLETLPELTGNNFYYHEIEGFEAVDEKAGVIGTILGVNDMAPQPYFIIVTPSGKEVLIPVRNEFIREVNRDEKRIYFKTPDGLIDLYTKPSSGQGEDES